jgi:hypothetical protein
MATINTITATTFLIILILILFSSLNWFSSSFA